VEDRRHGGHVGGFPDDHGRLGAEASGRQAESEQGKGPHPTMLGAEGTGRQSGTLRFSVETSPPYPPR
jgi:hypothetical protein